MSIHALGNLTQLKGTNARATRYNCSLCSHCNTSHYVSCSSVCLSVLYQLLNQKQKSAENPKLV